MSSNLHKFWELENDVIKQHDDELEVDNPFSSLTIEQNDDRYEVGLPWKGGVYSLQSDHYNREFNRLKCLRRKLLSEPELCKEYDNVIKDQLSNGIIERVPEQSNETESDNRESTNDECDTHYLPHHGVVRKERETSKLRIVYDGSARDTREGDMSINDCLDTGPNLIPKLFNILLRFRWNRIALTADIEKAFLMIGITPSDRDMLRFLWFKDPANLNSDIEHFRFTRLVFGLRPSPAILSSTILHHLKSYEKQYPEIVKLLSNHLYVDDLVAGAEDEDQAYDMYENSKQIMKEGGFNLRKWNTNNSNLTERIKVSELVSDENKTSDKAEPDRITAEDETYTKSTTGYSDDRKEDNHSKVLGLHWNYEHDEFEFQFSGLVGYAKSLPDTKRSLLKFSAKIYDPLGFLSPVVIRLKLLFQELCIEKTDWDSPLSGHFLLEWNNIIRELEGMDTLRIPRCYFRLDLKPQRVELHAFSDASKGAYAAVVYLRSIYNDGSVAVKLLASKTKVAPIKGLSIPRLELLGAYILALLVNTVTQSLPDNVWTIFYWIDSLSALCWIRNDKCWKQFVRERVNTIRNLTDKNSWRFCPGTLNPADLPTRGISAQSLSDNQLWWNGPCFLQSTEDQWPEDPLIPNNIEAVNSELVKNQPNVYHSLVTNDPDIKETRVQLDKVIECNKFSSLTRLLRVTSYVLRFIYNLKKSVPGEHTHDKHLSKELTASEIEHAEILWLRTIQASSFTEEIVFLSSRRKNEVAPIRVKQFGLYLDELGLLKCGGRLHNSSMPLSTRNPILLPSNNKFVELLVRDNHTRVQHNGVKDTLTTIREKYWILKGRQVVKRIIKTCVICRRAEGKPYSSPPSPDLPEFRVSEEPPFTNVGLDFAGPLLVRRDTVEDIYKVYILLFTCASTRALHLELTQTLNVQSFLLAFRRFASRRGLPARLISDNAKTFKSSCKEIRRITRSEEVWRYLTDNRIQWEFIAEKAPWWGGFWERLVKSVKLPLKKVIGRGTLFYDQLHSLLVEIEGLLNARPLTYVYDDQESISYALTPSHLIYGRRITNTPNGGHYEITSTFKTLTKAAKHHKNLLANFTKQWRVEYLNSLREQAAYNAKLRQNRTTEIKQGDIVILRSDSTNRMFWKIGKVEELQPGRDGKVRSALVRVCGDKRQTQLLRRPVQHLVPIEVQDS